MSGRRLLPQLRHSSTCSAPIQDARGEAGRGFLCFPGLFVASKAATPQHRQPGVGILSLDKIQHQGTKFTIRAFHTSILTPSPSAPFNHVWVLQPLRLPGLTWARHRSPSIMLQRTSCLFLFQPVDWKAARHCLAFIPLQPTQPSHFCVAIMTAKSCKIVRC